MGVSLLEFRRSFCLSLKLLRAIMPSFKSFRLYKHHYMFMLPVAPPKNNLQTPNLLAKALVSSWDRGQVSQSSMCTHQLLAMPSYLFLNLNIFQWPPPHTHTIPDPLISYCAVNSTRCLTTPLTPREGSEFLFLPETPHCDYKAHWLYSPTSNFHYSASTFPLL